MTTSYSSVNSLDDFTIIGGNDFTFSFSITEDGLPVNLTGATLLLKIAPYGQPNNVITTITGSVGSTTDVAEFVLSSTVSEQMVGGKYMYQPIIEDTGGTIHRPKQGTFLLIQAIGAFSDVIEVPEAAYYIYGEGTNTYTSTNTTITSYYAGLSIVLYVQNTNSANATLELSGVVGTKNLMKFDSIGGKVVLVAGDLLINKKYLFVYDGTEWVLVGLTKSEIRSMLDPTYAPLASPTFTGNPTAPTPSVGDNDTSIATTAFVNAEISNDRPYSDTNPLMDGIAAQGTSEKISRQDHVHPTDTSRAPLDSPTFTGTPAAPTATAGTNTTQIATTAFVLANNEGGWTIGSGTWTYVSADAPTFVFNIPSDVTGIIQPGYRIKLTQTTVKYFIVTAVGSFSGGNTPITIYGGTDYTLANAAITNPFYSNVKIPFGFPMSPSKWTVEVTDVDNETQASPTAGTWYNVGSLSITVPIGVWRITKSCAGYIIVASAEAVAAYSVRTTLSTTNNSESDNDWHDVTLLSLPIGTNVQQFCTHWKQKVETVTTKSVRYLNILTGTSGAANLSIRGDIQKTILRAECVYL